MATVREYDLVVVGHGMAGLAAGIRAAELGRSVAILEKCPADERGGQTAYCESFRVPSADTDLSEWGYEFAVADYTVEDFYRDIMDRTGGRAEPTLARTVAERAGPTIEWLTELGVDWQMEPLAVGYTAGRTWFEADEFLEHLTDAARSTGVDIHYETAARAFRQDDDLAVTGVDTARADERVVYEAGAVVLACGGYESSPERRARYLGPGYDDLVVRGSGGNTGEAIDMAMAVGARPAGQWSGAHVAIIDAGAPRVGGGANRVDGYQYGVILDTNGERFLDESADARAHTYAAYGRRIFERPGHIAYIIVDGTTRDLVRATGPSDPTVAGTIEDLLAELELDAARAIETIEAYNRACDPGDFDPTVLDGNDTAPGLRPPKSNWARPLAEPPFVAYPVTGGITFTFGGIATTPDAAVLDGRDRVIPGFYAAGNCTGGLFYDNYPGGTALTNAAVFGKIAAEDADAALG